MDESVANAPPGEHTVTRGGTRVSLTCRQVLKVLRNPLRL